MIIRMSQPWRHPTSGLLYYRSRLPADLSAMAGRTVTVEVAGHTATVKVGGHVKVSLRTGDVAEARLRHAAVQAQIEQRWLAERNGAVALTHKQVMALAGAWYREMVSEHSDNPGDAENWVVFQDLLAEALCFFDPDGDGIEREPYNPVRGAAQLRRIGVNIEPFLEARSLNLDEHSRLRLVEQVAAALVLAAKRLEDNARGDYGKDRNVGKFPPLEATPAPKEPIVGSSLEALFDGWANEVQPVQSTRDQWRSSITSFVSFVGHGDAAAIERKHVIAWMGHLLALGNTKKTINGSKLAALNAIYRWGVGRDLVSHNPAHLVRVRKRDNAPRMGGFSQDEAATILQAAAVAPSNVYRWVPLLCAQSGARVSEIGTLRTVDILVEDGIWCMSITAEAGAVKNPWSQRKVPLHPYVIAQGFLEFVKSRQNGPLFFDPSKRSPSAKRPPAKIVSKNVAQWVHKLGLNVGIEARKAPNHAWRHLFRTMCRDAIVPDSICDAIQGHRPKTEGAAYGETRLATLAQVIARLPLAELHDSSPHLIKRSDAASVGTSSSKVGVV